MKPIWKIHIGMIIGFFITFISTFIIIGVSVNSNIGEISPFLPIALFFTYEYLIINFLKENLLAEESKEKFKRELNYYNYHSAIAYRVFIKIFLSVCIVMAPIMWALAIIIPFQ